MNRSPTLWPRTERQLRASDPGSHVWVSASAGTGKTQVLTDRMLRLMLAGSPPERILALTFTKAAAAEMQNRLTKTLALWLRLDDAALGEHLGAIGAGPTPAMLERARALFALSLDVPGGLKVQTLHGFAQGLLAAFPLEAGLPPGFTALDERDTQQLKGRALNEMIEEAKARQDERLLDDLAELAVARGEGGVMQLLGILQSHAAGLKQFGSADAVEPSVRRWLGLRQGETKESFLREMLAPGTYDDGRLKLFADIMASWSTQTGDKAATDANYWLALDAAGRADNYSQLRNLIFTTENKMRKPALASKRLDLRDLMEQIGEDVRWLDDKVAKFAIAETASRCLRVGVAYTARYGALKRARVAIDYDDMIAEAAALLGEPGIPGWVAWKLDSRFDHMLVDEAQDTNPAQWAIVRKLSEDFFDTDDSRSRSLFVVGDMKQAIYGFQGTDPKVFAQEELRVEELASAAGRPLDSVPLDRSFRSGPAVLDLVNAFVADIGPERLGLRAGVPPHVPNRSTAASQVVLWPMQVPGMTAEEQGADQAADSDDEALEAGQEAAEQLMARQLGHQVKAWLTQDDPGRLWLPSQKRADGMTGRFAEPQDILLLFRKRSSLMAATVTALHECGVRVAGVDRLLLTEPYAVLDLLALVRFAVQPEDDLNLACLLVSPFISWDHEAVRRIAGDRRGSLWAALEEAADPASLAARGWLGTVLGMADKETPYRFLDTILSAALDGRRKLLARLGTQAIQAIDELLCQALAYEADHPPALEGFLAWIAAEGVLVKRDADAVASEVRLMTIHGAKGLEAPVVVLADAAHKQRRNTDGYVRVKLAGHTEDVPLFHGGAKALSGEAKALHEAMKQAEAEEDLRLLYVALTRAADHLFIAGAVGAKEAAKLDTEETPRWHLRLRRLMEAMPAEALELPQWRAHALGGQAALRISAGAWTPAGLESAEVVPDKGVMTAADGIEIGAAPTLARPPRPLTPSALGRDELASPPPTPAMREAAARGRLLHALFERLPGVSPERREAVALAWLKGQGAKDAPEIAAAALAVIEAEQFAALFGPKSLAEAPIAGIDRELVIAGTVDRLVVNADRMLVVDFKTGLKVPVSADAVPVPYVRQMAAYRAVLARAFPGRTLQAGLLYTAAPKLILLPAKLMDAHWPPTPA